MAHVEDGYISEPYAGSVVKEESGHRHRSAHYQSVSVEALMTWCNEHELNPADVLVTGGHLKWTSPMTADEVTFIEEHNKAAELRTLKWERHTYARLKAKFEESP